MKITQVRVQRATISASVGAGFWETLTMRIGTAGFSASRLGGFTDTRLRRNRDYNAGSCAAGGTSILRWRTAVIRDLSYLAALVRLPARPAVRIFERVMGAFACETGICALGAGAPLNKPAVLRSSSSSGQCKPYPPPDTFQFLR